jgi:CBS domain containing-hemolysin-like protein
MTYLGRLPSASDHFVWDDLRVEVVDMDRRRIDKVLVNRLDTVGRGDGATGRRGDEAME